MILNSAGVRFKNCFKWFTKKLSSCDANSAWMRRHGNGSAQARNELHLNSKRQAQHPAVTLQSVEPFNPNHRRYRTCCCHAKSFTVTFCIIELFILCFIMVAIVPDFNTKICGPFAEDGKRDHAQHFETVQAHVEQQLNDNPSTMSTVTTGVQIIARQRRQITTNEAQQQQQQQAVHDEHQQEVQPSSQTTPMVDTGGPGIAFAANETGPENNSLHLLHSVTCSLTTVWLSWAFTQMFAIVLLCYGIRSQRWQMMIPHIVARMFCALAVWLVIICLIGAFARPGSLHMTGHLILVAFLFILLLWIGLLLKSEIRCAEFVKRSAETGFSVCRTRPIGPPTVSQSDERVRERRAESANPWTKSAGAKPIQTPTNVYQREKPQAKNQSVVTEMTVVGEPDAVAAAAHTRPSTAGSSNIVDNTMPNAEGAPNQQQQQQQQQLEMYQKHLDMGTTNNIQSHSANLNEETTFGGLQQSMLAKRRGRPTGLPPLRHTFRV
uniref:Uncharacterized protein n=1 Tax=Globodera rostochiensis TaxID=31243 RepID=A0A914I9T2_GLORO